MVGKIKPPVVLAALQPWATLHCGCKTSELMALVQFVAGMPRGCTTSTAAPSGAFVNPRLPDLVGLGSHRMASPTASIRPIYPQALPASSSSTSATAAPAATGQGATASLPVVFPASRQEDCGRGAAAGPGGSASLPTAPPGGTFRNIPTSVLAPIASRTPTLPLLTTSQPASRLSLNPSAIGSSHTSTATNALAPAASSAANPGPRAAATTAVTPPAPSCSSPPPLPHRLSCARPAALGPPFAAGPRSPPSPSASVSPSPTAAYTAPPSSPTPVPTRSISSSPTRFSATSPGAANTANTAFSTSISAAAATVNAPDPAAGGAAGVVSDRATGASVDPREASKFAALAASWWRSGEGPFAPLHALNPARVRFVRQSLAALMGLDGESPEPLAGLRVLDVGCGGGILSEALARLGAAVHGIDVTRENVEAARLHARTDPRVAARIRYDVISAEDLAAAASSSSVSSTASSSSSSGLYDVVVASEVLEHVSRPHQLLPVLASLLAPPSADRPSGGALVASTLNRTPASWGVAILGAEYLTGAVPRGTHHWRKFITPEELAIMAESCGLRVWHAAGMAPVGPRGLSWQLGDDLSVNYIATLRRRLPGEDEGEGEEGHWEADRHPGEGERQRADGEKQGPQQQQQQ